MGARILNFLLYQAGWFALVLGAARDRPWGMVLALFLTAVHLALVRRPGREAALVAAAGLVGILVDGVLQAVGILSYPSGPWMGYLAPPFDLVLWLQFATLVRFCLSWLLDRPLAAALFGMLGGPAAFRAGEALGAVELGHGPWIWVPALALAWGVAMPLLAMLGRRIGGGPGSYRFEPATDPDQKLSR